MNIQSIKTKYWKGWKYICPLKKKKGNRTRINRSESSVWYDYNGSLALNFQMLWNKGLGMWTAPSRQVIQTIEGSYCIYMDWAPM